MKRVFVVFLSLLLICMISVPALAAGSAHMSVSASASQLYRGDMVTFTVSISAVEDCTAAGFVVKYDSNVFEWVSGKVLVSGATMSNFSGGTATLAFDSGRAVSGEIFQFVLKVKDNAPFGSATVSGSSSVKVNQEAISASAGSASVTVVCQHEYGTPVKTDDLEHVSQCSHCGEKKTEGHSWQDVSIIQAATCKDPGSKNVQCTDCGFQTQQVIPVNEDHSYSSWSKVNGSTHTRTCSVCQKVDNASHSWNSGKATKEATCTETGNLLRTCTGCGTTREDTIPLAEHSYSPFTRVDAQTHTHSCTVCQFAETLEHTYESGWQHDADAHFLSCDGCGEKKDRSAHIPGAAATDTTPQLCTVCERMLMPELSHEHAFESVWSADEQAHWHSCESCIITDGWQEHSFADVCSDACGVCGTQRQAPHQPEDELSADAAGHWYDCGLCEEKLEFTEHTPGPAATATSAQYCAVCQLEMAPVLPHDPVYDQGTTLHWHECACGERVEASVEDCQICKDAGRNRQFPWWILCVAEAVVLGGVILFLFLRLKKLRKDAMYQKWMKK